jgi:hypothetical protein
MMGCDIHLFVEVNLDNIWLHAQPIFTYEYNHDYIMLYNDYSQHKYFELYFDRDYDLFELLANVMGNSCLFRDHHKGIPLNCSPEVKQMINQWSSNPHSHSYLTIKELLIHKNKLQTTSFSDALDKLIELDDVLNKIINQKNKKVLLMNLKNSDVRIKYCLHELILKLKPKEYIDTRIVFFFDN